uniref:Uncharacterized protein n=1 Tax=Solanum tuberosum TaxID=4113 RepID=M1AGR0_SOLTU
MKDRNGDAKPHEMEPPTPHSFMKTSSRESVSTNADTVSYTSRVLN